MEIETPKGFNDKPEGAVNDTLLHTKYIVQPTVIQ